MKNPLLVLMLLFYGTVCLGQKIQSGIYDGGLQLAFDSSTNKLTGFYENYTGWDEATNQPLFSCIFYIEGYLVENIFKIQTYFPANMQDSIQGTIELLDKTTLKLSLKSDHGGCWNVQNFLNENAIFTLEHEKNWIQIKFSVAEKTYFYRGPSSIGKQDFYFKKNEMLFVEKTTQDWSFCTYFGETILQGWIKNTDLNKL